MYQSVQSSIRKIKSAELNKCLSIIHVSFATVANEYDLTEQNCPKHPSFMKFELLKDRFDKGYLMFGLYEDEQLVGYVSISKNGENTTELHNLAILPEYRHKGYGKQLLDFCKQKTKEMNCNKIKIDIIEDNIQLKKWYLEYGFVHTHKTKLDHLPFTIGFMEMQV